MTLLKDSATSHLTLTEQASTPDAPGTGAVKLYALTDGTLAYLDDADVEHVLSEAASHDPVTIDADAAAILDLTDQEIGLDTQTANYVFAGPATGAADEPTFRALVAADLPAIDAADVTYTPTTVADWDSDTDPGDLDAALDQLAERVTDVEEAGYIASITDQHIFTREGEVEATAGTLRLYNHTGAALTITRVWADVNTAPTGASLIVDVHKDGTTIFTTQSNRPTITATNYEDDGTPDVTTWADGSYLTMDVDQVGSTVAGSDLTVTVVFTK
jgi:hypothetical protein